MGVNMEKEILISVVIPVYKVELYLKECVDSVINQSYSNLEIILVDDGSPDSCGKICDEYKNKDSRVKVIHKENGGLSDARNAGIDVANGQLITFLDSDDYISKDMIEKLYINLINCHADVSMCAKYCFGEKINPYIFKKSEKCIILENNDSLKFIYNDCWEAWSKLYKMELFKNLRYPKGVLYEDFALTPKIFFHVHRSVYTPEALYYYRQRTDSIMTSIPQSRADVIRNADENIQFFINNKLDDKTLDEIFKCIKRELNRKRILADRSTDIGKIFINEFNAFQKKYLKMELRNPKTLYSCFVIIKYLKNIKSLIKRS